MTDPHANPEPSPAPASEPPAPADGPADAASWPPDEPDPPSPDAPPVPDTPDNAPFPCAADNEPPTFTRAEAVLLQRAVRHGWDIPDEARAVIPSAMLRIVKDPLSGPTHQMRAASVLAQLDAANTGALAAALKHKADSDANTVAREALGPSLGDLIANDPAAQEAALQLGERLMERERARRETGAGGPDAH